VSYNRSDLQGRMVYAELAIFRATYVNIQLALASAQNYR
jgi:hypothetical protein